MNTVNKYFLILLSILTLGACGKDDKLPVSNDITLHFENTFKDSKIVLGDINATSATINISAEGQSHYFSELKYVISNIRLVAADGSEFSYHVNDLDKGATVIDHAKPESLNYILTNIPAGEYRQLKFGLGVKAELNTLDQIKFPAFYAKAGANDTKMMWEWGTGYRFTKIEGFYEDDRKPLSIHTGSTVEGTDGDPESYTQGVDAYRDITLDLNSLAKVGESASHIWITVDFNKLLSGKSNTILLGAGNATPNIHTAVNMVKFVDNIGGNGQSDISGMFSIKRVE